MERTILCGRREKEQGVSFCQLKLSLLRRHSASFRCILAHEGGTYCCTFPLRKNAPCERGRPLLSSEPLSTLRSKAHIARSSLKTRSGTCNQPISARSRRRSAIRHSSATRRCPVPSGILWQSGGAKGSFWR